MSTERRVLVLDAHTNPALAAVRSLGRHGMSVTVVAEAGRLNLAGRSRYTRQVIDAPPAGDDPEGYFAVLRSALQQQRYDLLLPVTDTTVAIVNCRRDELSAVVTIALPDVPTLDLATDKLATIELAASAGVATPPTRRFDSRAEALAAAGALRYPCVVKSRYSKRWPGAGPVRAGGVRFAADADAFARVYSELDERDPNPLVQEFVGGDGVGVFALVDHGRVLTSFVHRRLREVNPTGGPASLAESLPLDDRLVAPAHRLLAAARWHGVAMVEFKDPGSDAPPVLMEVNGRLWGSLPLAIAAGVDFPVLLAQLFLGETPAVPSSYRVGVRCRHLKGDLSHLGGVLRGAPAGWPGVFPGVLQTLARILPMPGRWTPYNMRLTDPWPALAEAWRYARDEFLPRRPSSSKA